MIRAKFKCSSVRKDETVNEYVEFYAANGKKDSANEQWAKLTPGGNLSMTISNPDALGRFKPGSYYFLDFSETTEEA